MSDEPISGTYRTRLVKNGPWVGVRLYFGQPILDGEEQDRSPRWCVVIDGKTDRFDKDAGHRVPLDPMSVWPHCGREPISEADYLYMTDYAAWAKAHSPDKPQASPRTPINLRGASLLP